MRKTLLDKAHAAGGAIIKGKRTALPEQQLRDVARAWLAGEIGDAQLTAALGRKPHAAASTIATAARALRRAIIAGEIRIK
jgi:hypothetical protein